MIARPSDPCQHCGFSKEDNPIEVKIYHRLSPIQKKTLRFVVMGMHPKDIAKELGVSYNAARGYLHMCFVKTGMDNRKDLISFVIKRPTLLRLLKELQ